MQFEQGELDACVVTCRRALERGAEVMAPYALKAKAWARIGAAESRRGDLAAAVAAYDSSLLESHSDEVYEKRKRARAALAAAEAAAYRDPALALEAKERGNAAFKASDFPRAIAEYSEAIKRDPDAALLYANRAAARTKVLDVSGAMADCEQCIKLDPALPRGYARKGAVHFLLKEYHKALDAYKKALELEPENEDARDGLRRTVAKINEAPSDADQKERAARAMQDPEIQSILHDPMVNAALEDLQRDSGSMRRVMQDPVMAAKIQKLIAAGVLGVK